MSSYFLQALVFICKGKELEIKVVYATHRVNSACPSIWSLGGSEGCWNHLTHEAISEEDDDENDVWTNYVKSELWENYFVYIYYSRTPG